MSSCSTCGKVACWLVTIGALNWGAVALGYNVVDMLLGAGSTLSTVVYALVGISGVYCLVGKFTGKCSK